MLQHVHFKARSIARLPALFAKHLLNQITPLYTPYEVLFFCFKYLFLFVLYFNLGFLESLINLDGRRIINALTALHW